MARRTNKEDNRMHVRNEQSSHQRHHEKEALHKAPQQRARNEMMRDEIIRIRQSNDLYERQSI
jgi:hypothetical protein